MTVGLQLHGYAGIDEGVYIRGKILDITLPCYKFAEEVTSKKQRSYKIVPLLTLQRFSYPTFEEALKYLSERSALSLQIDIGKAHYTAKQNAGKAIERRIDECLNSLTETVVNAIMQRKSSIVRFMAENMTQVAENDSLFPQYYTELSYGYIPKSTISRILRSGSKLGTEWYILELTKLAQETGSRIGLRWAVDLPFYYDENQRRIRINGDGTIVATNGKVKANDINNVLRQFHHQLDNGAWKNIPDSSEERLREAACEGLKSLEELLAEISGAG